MAVRREDSVRAVRRALDLLAAINGSRGATVPELVRDSGIPRPTVLRLLATLAEAGYVLRTGRRWEVTPGVARLASGFNFDTWLAATSAPILLELLGKVGWPSDVMMLGGAEIHVRASNRPQCGVAIEANFQGMRSPLADSASGRAYLAWCPEAERRRLIALCVPRAQERAVLRELDATRVRGYGLRDAALKPPVGAIAVPVMLGASVACVLDLVFLPRVEPVERIAARCLGPLREAAAGLSAAFATLHQAAPVRPADAPSGTPGQDGTAC
ncbi:helix-turn-helix domain-containing protein [Roseomonas terrae]|jgi:IclR family mhp operon transcriptional activator|uniref:Helix-turn-helix domain-containing protein n=1 Tax=Neoroseomonas terrae TaxID=424799 RepID=A0ABS5EBD0_9PROT|nr:helix-turn-helix domain-containing protein [Neoroseomonas terrae]MBR0648339.1 helix-turn-helix domain-containing protein [Neoroseomonas terrae]